MEYRLSSGIQFYPDDIKWKILKNLSLNFIYIQVI